MVLTESEMFASSLITLDMDVSSEALIVHLEVIL